MTRQIDLDNLDADQVIYIRQRPWLIQEAKLRGVDDIEERLEAVENPTVERGGDYDDLKLAALRQTAESRGVDKSGSAKEIRERLQEADAAAAGTSEEATGAQEALQG
jgi:hypothetical protein